MVVVAVLLHMGTAVRSWAITFMLVVLIDVRFYMFEIHQYYLDYRLGVILDFILAV